MVYVSEFAGGYDISYRILASPSSDGRGLARLGIPALSEPNFEATAVVPVHACAKSRVLTDTQNAIFALIEVELYGYPVATYGMCPDRCRHGGRCMHAAQRCTSTQMGLAGFDM